MLGLTVCAKFQSLIGPPRQQRDVIRLQIRHVPANRDYDSPVRRLVREGQAFRIVNAQRGVDDYDKWLRLYKKLIVDRSTH